MRVICQWMLMTIAVGMAAVEGLNCSRKSFLSIAQGSLFGTVFSVGTCNANAAVLQSGGCALGVGDGCDDVSDGNEFIKELQQRSALKREEYTKEALDAYNMKNYPDFFKSIGKVLVKMPDGTFQAFSDQEFESLKKENKIVLEIPRAMGGKVQDLTQKPILVMRE